MKMPVTFGFILLLLVGCGGQMTVHPVSQENIALSPARATQNLIDETNAGLAAAYTTVLNGLQSGAMTKSEAAGYQANLDKASDALDASSVFLGKGDITSAQGQIQIAQSIIALAQSKLIELKQKGK